MSKKAPKKGKTKQTVQADDPEPWIEELKTLFVNDDKWQCNVTFIMDTNCINMSYISSFNDMFISGKNVRPHIRVISNLSLALSTMENIYNFSNKKDTTPSNYMKLCNESLQYCATDGFKLNAPPQILASLLKYHLFELKNKTCAETLTLQDYEQKKKKVQDESLMQLENFIKHIPTGKKDKGKSPPKKATKSGGKSVIEKFTNLRKRNEEFFDDAIIHDEGPNGPQLYVVLTGFRQPDLPLELLKLQIPLLAIIKLHDLIDDTGNTICSDFNKFLSSVLGVVSQRTKIKQRRYSNAQEEFYLHNQSIHEFWDQLKLILYNRDNVTLFKNTMFLQFYPHLSSGHELSDRFNSSGEIHNTTCGSELQESIYQQICFLQYDIQDLKRQHKTYSSNLKIQDVEEKNKFSVNDMQFYSSIMDPIPSEMINIPLILDAILLQVEYSSNIEPNASKTSSFISESDNSFSKRVVEKESKLFAHLKSLDKAYDLFNYEEISPNTHVDEPIVLVEGDEIGKKTYWWEQKNSVKEISCKILSCFWDNIFRRHLLCYDDIFNSNIQDNDNDLFELLKGTGDLTFLEKLSNIPCNHHKIFFEDKVHVFCADPQNEEVKKKSVPFCIDGHISIIESASKKFHHYSDPSEGHFMGQKYDDHGYCFEEMTRDIILQNLFLCFESFNCFDVQQDYFREKIFLRFHNRKTCTENEYLIGTLRTPTALRDFYDYTVDEEFYWLNEKELLYIESLSKAEKDLLNYEMEQLRKLEYKKQQRTQRMCSNSNFLSPDSIKSKNQPERYSLASQASDTKSLEIVEENCANKFLEAFDIDLSNRVQFSERRQQIMLSSQSKLLVKKLSRLYVDDSLFLQISIYGHTLYLFGPFSKGSDVHFHLLHENGLVLYFKKNLYLKPSKYSMDYGIFQSSNNNKFLSNVRAETEIKPLEEILKRVKYHLSLSLPNSLYLEVVNAQQVSLYIKQHYISKILQPSEIRNEEFRCSLLDGKLVKFMNDDSVCVYYPNGTIYYCKKMSYESADVEDVLSVVTNVSAEEQTSNVGKFSSKSKRGSKKEKINTDAKTEFSKPKHVLRNNLITVVDSFECTLTNGQRISVDGEKSVELEPLFCKSYTDILNGINITERHDGTTLIHSFEGELIVNFPDGTRITTFPKFAKDEILIDLTENVKISSNSELTSDMNNSDIPSNKSIFLMEGFVSIEVHHLIEHPNFASISVDCFAENLTIDLPGNDHVFLSPEGWYKVNFENKAELLVQGDELMFRELSSQCLPEFTIYLNNFCEDTVTHNYYTNPPESTGEHSLIILSCMDYLGNILEVDSTGDVHSEGSNPIASVCKCAMNKKERFFIINNQFNGLEILPPCTLDDWVDEAKNNENHVYHHYSSSDHHVLLLLKPVLQNEYEKWLKIFQKIKVFPRFPIPSTYNIKGSWFNPFPKINFEKRVKIPDAFLASLINRVNCNIHLQRQSFMRNKIEGDRLRINKHADMCVKLYEQGSVKFWKANKTFIEFAHNNIIGKILSRVRKRVIKRLEYRKTEEYEVILRKRILLPYFDSSKGAVHALILKIIDSVIEKSVVIEEGSRLEKLLKLPLHHLTDDDLDFIHDKIAEFTVGSICSCLKNRMACKLRILLLAGRILHRLFSDMISVFYLYAENMKRKKLADERRKAEATLLNELLMRPMHLLTENDFQIVHDRLKTLPYCSCSVSPEKCKLKLFLLASAVLNDFFPNLDSVLKSPAFNIGV